MATTDTLLWQMLHRSETDRARAANALLDSLRGRGPDAAAAWADEIASGAPFIQITRYPYEEPYLVNLLVSASNGHVQGALEIYANADALTSFATDLMGFPRHRDHEALWELGSEAPEDRFAFYFRLRVKQVASNGRCAVELRFNNNRAPPNLEVLEFSILAFPADLDRLARLLQQFGQLQHKVLMWNVTDGSLRADA